MFTHTDPDTGEAALHVAVSLNHEAIVHQLLMLGASPTVQDREGLTPVMTACQYGHIQSLEQLATKGVHPTSKSHKSSHSEAYHITDKIPYSGKLLREKTLSNFVV